MLSIIYFSEDESGGNLGKNTHFSALPTAKKTIDRTEEKESESPPENKDEKNVCGCCNTVVAAADDFIPAEYAVQFNISCVGNNGMCFTCYEKLCR